MEAIQAKVIAGKALNTMLAVLLAVSVCLTLQAIEPGQAHAAESAKVAQAGGTASRSLQVGTLAKKQAAKKAKVSLTLKNVSNGKMSLGKGNSKKITVSATKGAKVTFKSLNKNIASVDSKGVVHAKKVGKATIKVKAAKGKKTTTKKVVVTVKDPIAEKNAAAEQKAAAARKATTEKKAVEKQGAEKATQHEAAQKAETERKANVAAGQSATGAATGSATGQNATGAAAGRTATGVVAGQASTGAAVGQTASGKAAEKNGVVYENGNYYYYSSGVMQRGWVKVGSNWCYCDASTGVMKRGGEFYIPTGYNSTGAGWRLFDSNGSVLYGWQTVNGNIKYYRFNSGVRVTGEVYLDRSDGKTAAVGYRLFDSNGCLQHGWQTINGRYKYYSFADGVRAQGEVYLDRSDGKTAAIGWRLFDSNGFIQYGWQNVNGSIKYYSFADGVRAQGEVYLDKSDGVTADVGWRYFDSNGALQHHWQTVNGVAKYYNPSNGVRVQGRVWIDRNDGVSAHDGFRYFDSNGALYSGWLGTGSSARYYDPRNGSVEARGRTQVYHSANAYNTYYFDLNTGYQRNNVTIDGWYYRADGVGTPVAPQPNPFDREYAVQIFNAYNDYRASVGLGRVTWNESYYAIAQACSQKCSARNELVHKLGIPANQQTYISDILQYASWKKIPAEAIERWKNSTNHRQQMKCPTAKQGAVAAYYDGNRWWYTIVYDFVGQNYMVNG